METPLKRKMYPYEQGRQYIKKHGYLKLLCHFCGEEFLCSGHCIFQSGYEDRAENRCLCGKCDNARISDFKWYLKCQKDFPFSWVINVGKIKNENTS